MSWKQLPAAVLLLTVLLSCFSPASSIAASTISSQSEEGDAPDQTGSEDAAVQVVQGSSYTYFFPLIFQSADWCDHTIGPEVTVADARSGYSNVETGDTVCIAAGVRDGLSLRNFKGTPEKPITFINHGGQVVIDSAYSVGILVANSQFLRLTGTGTGDVDYGIKVVASTNVGVGAGFKSSDFEIDHIEVTGVGGAAISAKTTAVCSDGSANDYDYDADGIVIGDPDDVVNRSNFTQLNSVFHDNYIHGVGTEGFYVGGSSYPGREVKCSSGLETIYDPVLKGVEIYDNMVTDTGWDSVQVGSAEEDCYVHHNRILRDSLAARKYQQGGVINDRGSVCHIYNNSIRNGGGVGIFVQGKGGNMIFNNIIVNAGQNNAVGNNGGDGITFCGGSDPIHILHNTIIRPRNFGIRLARIRPSDRVQNNIIVEPDNYAIYGASAYIQTWGGTSLLVTNNFNTQTIADVRFTDPTSDDFSIRPDSPVVDSGADLNFGMVPTDYSGVARPQGSGYDVGAYELEFPPRP